MADYYTPTVVQEVIPNADMTPLEQFLLSRIFEAEPDGDGTYFFSSEGALDFIWADRTELKQALDVSRDAESQVRASIKKQLADAEADDDGEIELDMSEASWEHILQDIVQRSSSLRYITVSAAFTCSKMRADGFGGMALFITADAVKGCSTVEFIADCLSEIASDPENG